MKKQWGAQFINWLDNTNPVARILISTVLFTLLGIGIVVYRKGDAFLIWVLRTVGTLFVLASLVGLTLWILRRLGIDLTFWGIDPHFVDIAKLYISGQILKILAWISPAWSRYIRKHP